MEVTNHRHAQLAERLLLIVLAEETWPWPVTAWRSASDFGPFDVIVRVSGEGGPRLRITIPDEFELLPLAAYSHALERTRRWWAALESVEREPHLVLGEE